MSFLDALADHSLADATKALAKVLTWALPVALGTGWYWQIRAANKQRVAESYAMAVKSLYRLREMPYRIRRRTSDSPEALSSLASSFHDLQEEIDYWLAWTSGRGSKVATSFETAASFVRKTVGPYVDDAWGQPPVKAPQQMVLKNSEAGLYPMSDVDERIRALSTSLS